MVKHLLTSRAAPTHVQLGAPHEHDDAIAVGSLGAALWIGLDLRSTAGINMFTSYISSATELSSIELPT